MASKELNCGVYLIEHLGSGRRYVGSACLIGKRWKEHSRQLTENRHHSRFLQRAWNKYGESAFRFSVALYCDKQNLLMYEQALIDGWKPAFNSAPTAGSQLGFRHSPESKARMSEAAKRTRNFTGHRHSIETKQRISLKKTGVTQLREHVERRKAAIRALPVPPSPSRRFTPEQIRSIRSRISSGVTQKALCSELGVSSSVLSEINTRKAYRWVD